MDAKTLTQFGGDELSFSHRSGESKNMTHLVNVEKFITDVFSRPAIWHRSYHLNKAFMEDTWDELAEIHNLPKKTLKAKWKGLRDNYRVEFKRIPRDDITGDLLVSPEDFESKWAHYKPLCFLAEHLRSRSDKNDFDASGFYMKNEGNSNDFDVDLAEAIVQTQQPQPVAQAQKSLKEILEEKPLLSNSYHHQALIAPTSQPNGGPANHNSNSNGVPRIKVKSNGLLQQSLKRPRVESIEEEYAPPQPSSPPTNTDDDYHFLMSLHPYMTQLSSSQKLRVRMKIQKLIFKELFKDEDDAEEGK